MWPDRHYNFDNPISIAAVRAAYEKGETWLMEFQAYLDENFRFTERYLKEHLPEAGFKIPESTYLACPRATLEEGLCRICEAVNTKHTEKYMGEQQ